MQQTLNAPKRWSDAGGLSRNRWNVLDLITIIAARARSAYLISEVDVTNAERLRARLAEQGTKVTMTAILLKAISIAQLSYPASRSYKLAWGNIVTEEEPIAGFTVEREVDGEPVVFFNTIRQAHEKSLSEIAAELEECGKSEIESVPQMTKELSLTRLPWLFRQIGIFVGLHAATLRRTVNSATFGLTSLGKFGIQALFGPNVSTCIFGVGSVEERSVVVNRKVEVRKMMDLSLSVDTNVMTMENAAEHINEIKRLIESGMAEYAILEDTLAEIVTLKPSKQSEAA